jgi:hypothetical protein
VKASSGEQRRWTPRRVLVLVVVLVIAFLVFCALWVGLRGIVAARDLQRSAALVSSIRSDLSTTTMQPAAQRDAKTLQQRASSAEALTSDPIWRSAEFVPVVGPDLRALRQISSVVSRISRGAVAPVVSIASETGVSDFAPRGGRVDVAKLQSLRPTVERVAKTVDGAQTSVRAIDTTRTVSQVTSRVRQLTTMLSGLTEQVAVARRVVTVAPGMLGANGPRDYLLLVENNAELRAGGGIIGSIVRLHTDDGRITLSAAVSGADIPKSDAPVQPLSRDTEGLYGSITGEYIQDISLTPRFDTTARLASAFWQTRYGERVDGVLAIDPVTLSYMLAATGPVRLATGDSLSSGNAVQLLLSEVYARYPDPRTQDAFFASAAGSVFQAITTRSVDAKGLIAALSKAAEERRIRVWSSHPSEERSIDGTAVSGALPVSTKKIPRFGVYLNDATGAKMDYYLTKQVAVGSQVCRRDGRPTWTVDVVLKNTAPADAATRLPEYVTGGGHFGVAPGGVGTNVAIYAPKAGVFLGASQDGVTASPQTAIDGEYPVVQMKTLLRPGQSTKLRVQFLGRRSDKGGKLAVESTPGVNATVTKTVAVRCETR